MGVTFRAVLENTDGPIGIVVPAEEMAKLGPGKRYPVVVTVGTHTYRNTVGWYQGAFRIAFSAENRAAAAVGPGDEVEVTLELDDAPRVLELPEPFSRALSDAGVLESFTALSYSKQRTFVEPWIAAKSDATRDKNLAKAIAAVS